MFRTIVTKSVRRIARWGVFFLPEERRRGIERWLRGRDQFQKLRRADIVIVSPGKSGRTWLRVMLSGFYHHAYGLRGEALLGFDNLHRKDSRIPVVFFTHDNYLKDYTGNVDSKRDFYDKKVVLMVRQPQDVVVSEYFNWKHRMKPDKMYLNHFPAREENVSIFDFTMRPCGLPRVLALMNLWASELPHMKDVLLLRYEDMRSDPAAEFQRIVRFMGGPLRRDSIEAAVEFASLENMRRMEQRETFRMGGGRMKPRDPSNPHSYKVRRALVGGYRDYYDEAETVKIDAMVDSELSPIYGYASPSGVAEVPGGNQT